MTARSERDEVRAALERAHDGDPSVAEQDIHHSGQLALLNRSSARPQRRPSAPPLGRA